jgi:hypothetical protein
MRPQHLLVAFFVPAMIAACSVSSSTTESSTSSTSPDGDDKCGVKACTDTEYCALRGTPNEKGEATWKEDTCLPYPTGCNNPKNLLDRCACIAKANGCTANNRVYQSECVIDAVGLSFGCL